jgi:hypothetical protein
MRRPVPRAVACWLTARYIRAVRATGRWTTERSDIPERLIASGKPFLVAFWHGRLLMMSEAWPYAAPFSMVVSQHPDGQLIARTIGHLGFGSIAGSTTRGGSAVMRAMLRALADGGCVGVTPDGPQGPRMHASAGVIQAARLAGVPIVPISYAARPNRLFESWDRLMVPLPFCRGIIRWGEPIEIPRDADEATVAAKTQLLEARLNDLVKTLDASLGLPEVVPAPAAPEIEAGA